MISFQFLESVKLQRNSDKYQLLKRDQTTETDREDYCYTKVSAIEKESLKEWWSWFDGISFQNALETTGLCSEEIINIFKILSVILKLGKCCSAAPWMLSEFQIDLFYIVFVIAGNLVFIPTTNIDGSGGCEITNEYGNVDPNLPTIS